MSEHITQPDRSSGFSSANEIANLDAERRASRKGGILKIAEDWPGYPQSLDERQTLAARKNQVITDYEAKFPESLHGVQVLSELAAYLQNDREVKRSDVSRENKKQIYRELTEYQFLITSFVLNNGKDGKFMEKFWESVKAIGAKESTQDTEALRSGVLSTVATIRSFEALGLNPQLSHPDEDAYDAIDIWADDEHAVQVKKDNSEKLELFATDDIEFPGVELESADGIQHISTHQPKSDMETFRTKVERYGRRENKPVTGYFMRIPYSMIDHNTGAPNAELLDQLRPYLGQQPQAEAA